MINKKIALLNQTTLESLKQKDSSIVIKKFTEAGLKILKADFGFSWWKNENEYSLAYISPDTPYTPNYPRRKGGNYVAQKTQKPLFVTDVDKKPSVIQDHVGSYMKSYVIIPIFFENNSYGNLVFCFKKKHNFNLQERSLCVALGNAAAQTITIQRLVTSEHLARLKAEEQQQRFQALIENSFDAIGLVNPQGEIVYASPSITKFTGYLPEELVGANMNKFIFEEDIPLVGRSVQEILQNAQGSKTVEFRYLHKDGDWRWMESTWLNMLGNPAVGSIVVNVRDINERKNSENVIREQSLHDLLTGLPNRQEFSSRFMQALEQAKRNRERLAIMFMDMDRFKNVNDRLGHDTGDAVLRTIASRLASSLRGEDVAARFGGDEFLVLVNQIHSSKDVAATAEKILRAVNLPINIANHTLHPSVSIGIAMYPDDGLDLEGLKKNADIALYRAKENGRNRFSLYDHSLNDSHQAAKFTLENELREALLYNQIDVFYQPIINLKKQKLMAAEALARWQHPERGLILPEGFIPLAEETGLIAELDKLVLKKACVQAKQWQDMGLPKFRVAVNLSAQQFGEPEFVSTVAGILAETGLLGDRLELEITESLAMSNLNLTNQNLRALKKLGVHITIDDFGTGYSSLNYLKRFPIHGLKIDKSFIRNCMVSAQDTSIAKAIVAMAQALNLKVTAEGVEELRQLGFLTSLGCDGAQGFFIGKPMPANDFPNWLMSKYPETIPVSALADTQVKALESI